MSRNDDSYLFRTQTPVALPSEPSPVPGRRLLWSIAVAMLLVGLASGLLYRELYQDAGDDITRLLPASTRLFTRVAHPRAELRKILTLDRWRDPDRLAASLQTRGVLSEQATGEVLGLPLSMIRRTLYAIDDAHFALVPTPSDVAMVGFLRVSDPWASQRMRADMGAFLEPVDRLLGFDIEAYHGLSDLLPWEGDRLPVRVVEIAPNTAITAGPEEALEDLLEARVSGLSQPLATREGFNRDAARWSDGLWLHANPEDLYDLVIRANPDGARDREPWRDSLRRLFKAVTVSSRIEAQDELLTLDLQLTPGAAAGPLRRIGDGSNHTLLDLVPADAPWVASISLADPAGAHRSIQGLLETLSTEVTEGPAVPIIEAALLLFGTREPTDMPTTTRGFRGEWIVFGHPADGDAGPWSILARVQDVDQALAHMEVFSLSLFGSAHAYGHVRRPDGALVHVVFPHDEELTSPSKGEVLAWRVHQGILMIAPDRRGLAATPLVGPSLGGSAGGQRARRSLPDRHPLLVMVQPSLLKGRLGPIVDRLIDAQVPDFLWAFTVARRGQTLRLRSNVGFWSAALMAGGASLEELDTLLLDGISPSCRRALETMCARYPDARPCQPLHPDRQRLARQTCQQLRL